MIMILAMVISIGYDNADNDTGIDNDIGDENAKESDVGLKY